MSKDKNKTEVRDASELMRLVKCTEKELSAINLIVKELQDAREKHPDFPKDRIHQTAIVAEEAGELVRASLHEVYERGTFYDCQKEAIQTAAMAIRFIIQE